MVIYSFSYEGDVFAYTSLRKAKSARAAFFDKSDHLYPDIIKVTLPDTLTLRTACSLLMRQQYAVSQEVVA